MKKSILALLLGIAFLLSGCGKPGEQALFPSGDMVLSTPANTTPAGTVPASNDIFSNRDRKDSYDTAGAVTISLNGDSIACDSSAVKISGTTATLSKEGTYILSGNLDNGMILPLYVLHPAAAADVQAAADRICHAFPHEDYPKQVYLWMLSCIRYDPAAPNSQNAYGALVQHSAVCKGIAKAYQLLMRLRQIPCILVEGTLDGVMKHVWNMVYLDGLWLHVDVTMGYPQFWSFTGASDIFGGYLRTTEEITRSHRIYHIEKLPVNTDGGENNGIEKM